MQVIRGVAVGAPLAPWPGPAEEDGERHRGDTDAHAPRHGRASRLQRLSRSVATVAERFARQNAPAANTFAPRPVS